MSQRYKKPSRLNESLLSSIFEDESPISPHSLILNETTFLLRSIIEVVLYLMRTLTQHTFYVKASLRKGFLVETKLALIDFGPSTFAQF